MRYSPHVTVIILNWNAWRDTIECLETVLKSDYDNFNVFLIDNGSEDDSVKQIINWAEGNNNLDVNTNFPEYVFPYVPKPIDLMTIKVKDTICNLTGLKQIRPKLTLFRNDCNAGFAIANNLGISWAIEAFDSTYIFLLNNDTVIAPGTLNRLVRAMENDSDIGAAQSVIYSYAKPEQVANAGGIILPWGQTKYYKKIDNEEIKRITFVNGCALFLRRETIDKYGSLTGEFFHGEEDFEYSLRLKQHKVKVVCIGNTAVYHKIGITAHQLMNRQTSNKVLLFAVNRLVDIKKFYPRIVWLLWRELALVYFWCLLVFQYKETMKNALRVIARAHRLSDNLINVDKSAVHSILKDNPLD